MFSIPEWLVVCGETLLPRGRMLYIFQSNSAGGQPREHSSKRAMPRLIPGLINPAYLPFILRVVGKCFLQCYGMGLSLEPQYRGYLSSPLPLRESFRNKSISGGLHECVCVCVYICGCV